VPAFHRTASGIAACLEKDRTELLAFYGFPAKH